MHEAAGLAELDRVSLQVREIGVLIQELCDDAVLLIGHEHRIHIGRRAHMYDG